MQNKVIFIGAGPGDPELITVKALNILKNAKVILYTGSLVPKEILNWAPKSCIIASSEDMDYNEIFAFLSTHIKNSDVIRLHTGDPSIYSTIAKQIEYLKERSICYEVIPGVTAAFGAASELGIEYTIPGVSQGIILSRVEGKTPNPEKLENILNCKNTAKVFYLSVSLLDELVKTALMLNYPNDTPCWIIEKATWKDQQVIKGSLSNIQKKVMDSGIKKTALILIGEYLNQNEKVVSHLYNKVNS